MNKFARRALRAGTIALGILMTGTVPGATTDVRLPPETVKLKPSRLAGYVLAQQKCQICHSADYISYQPPSMNLTQWTAEVAKMRRVYGAPIDDHEVKLIGVYLAATYGDAHSVSAADRALRVGQGASGAGPTAAAPAAPVAGSEASSRTTASRAIDVQALLGRNACMGCHAIDHKVVGPAFHDVAAKYKPYPDALVRVEASIRAGGAGKWGPVPMPPFASLSQAELKALAEFVMKQ
jgi:cytochrome c551/c552